MSLQEYSLHWSDALIQRVETHLRDLHTALIQYYESKGYETRVEEKKASPDGEEAATTTADVVSPAGSFLLRTCAHPVPFSSMHHSKKGTVGADLVLTIPEAKCSLVDVQDGRYLQCRQAFLLEVESYLRKIASGAEKRAAAAAAGDNTSDDGDEGEQEGKHGGHAEKANVAAAARFSRMEVERAAIHGCYSTGEKETLRMHFRRLKYEAGSSSSRGAAPQYESFHVNLHFRLAFRAGRVTGSAAIKKHPLYSYLILEDYLIPSYLKQLHEVCVKSNTLRRAIVILKCWAHHIGLSAPSSGHSEGLNGFVLAAMVLKLLEEGIVSSTMSDDNIVRAVWVHISRGLFTPGAITATEESGSSVAVIPMTEKRGEVAVLRLKGELMNVLFRTSTEFFNNVVKCAAEEALQFTRATEVFENIAFQPLQLRHDVALTICLGNNNTKEQEDIRSGDVVKKSSVYFSPRMHKVQAVLAILREALGVRASYVTAWYSGPSTIEVAIVLTSEAEGRNRLTRGPALEMAEAVAAFNRFWGADITSTRQFPDGGVYRCILWEFKEDMGTHTTLALSASTVTRRVVEFAIRKHLDAPRAEVSVLLGGLEGFLAERIGAEWKDSALLMHRSLLEASKGVQAMIADLPKNALPCKIIGFDIISESERHTEVFPVRPHLALTRSSDNLYADAYTGLSTAPVISPIHCVLSIDDKHKIPDTPEAIAMMKGAICGQLAKSIQHRFAERGADGKAATTTTTDTSAVHAFCTSHSVDVIFRGYLFRVYVAHYREVSLLRALERNAEAHVLEQKLFWSVQHAKFMRSVAFGHHSYANAVRLAKRWVSAMMLYEFILPEAIELLVANAYLSANSIPKTPASGFLRFVQLLATYDWSTPLVLPYTDEGQDEATAATLVRKLGEHQGLFIATPYAPHESPFTAATPRPMIMYRLVQLAKGVVALLLRFMGNGGVVSLEGSSSSFPAGGSGDVAMSTEREVFHASSSVFDFQMLFHPKLILQPDRLLHIAGAASAASSSSSSLGVTAVSSMVGGEISSLDSHQLSSSAATLARIWQMDELDAEATRVYITQLVEREPAAHAVRTVRAAIRDQGMVFYDALAPSAIFVVGVTASASLKQCQQMHKEVLRVGRGAILPASSFSVPSPTPAALTTNITSKNAEAASGQGRRRKGGVGSVTTRSHDKEQQHRHSATQSSARRPRAEEAGSSGAQQRGFKKARKEQAAPSSKLSKTRR